MKNNKQRIIYGYLPIGIAIQDLQQKIIGTGLSFDKIVLLFHQLYISRIRSANNSTLRRSSLHSDGWVSVDSRILKKLLTKGYSKYLNWAEENNLILRRRDEVTGGIKYTGGKHSQLIKIPQSLLQ